ncbi:MAG: SDR family oxidoreductase [Lachnospiraceae bacterium]
MAGQKVKSYLVIGASSDVGTEFILCLARKSREHEETPLLVLAHYCHHKERLEQIGKEYPGIEIRPLQADLREETQALRLVDQIGQYVKCPDYILHFPAITFDYMRYRELDTEYLRTEMNVQLYSFLTVTRAFLPLMQKEFGSRVLVMLSSYVAEELPPKFMADYVVAKYALLGAMKAAAAEFGGKNLKVNGISPVMMRTKFLQKMDSHILELAEAKSTIGRLPEPAELVPFIEKLLDPECSYNGYNMVVDESCFGAKEPEDD